jgi:predicted membrane protein
MVMNVYFIIYYFMFLIWQIIYPIGLLRLVWIDRKQIKNKNKNKDSETVFKAQKKCLKVIKGVNNWVSCRNMFGEFKILLPHYIYLRFYVL